MNRFLYAERVEQVNGFRFITWRDLVSHVASPPRVSARGAKIAKRQSAVITASDAPGKTLDTVTGHGRMTMLRLDLDDSGLNLHQVAAELNGLGLGSYLIHSTANHKQGNNGDRLRVFIELACPVCLDEWTIVQTYLAYLFGADDCSSRPQQVMYLPVLFEGVKYEHLISQGSPLILSESSLYNDAKAFHLEQLEQAKQLTQERAAKVNASYRPQLIEGQISVIDAVNQYYDWPNLLRHYGYKQQGRAWLPPESVSKTAGAFIIQCSDGKQRYYSHHTSDPCSGERCLDKFDFIATRAYSGNRFECMKGVLSQFPEIDAHNKAVFARTRHTQFEQNKGRYL